jgi:hypothetical protein
MQWEQAASESRRVACAKRISKGEHFFGFGERTGYLDKLGRQMINWTTDPVAGQGPAPIRSTWPSQSSCPSGPVWPTASSSITPGAAQWDFAEYHHAQTHLPMGTKYVD